MELSYMLIGVVVIFFLNMVWPGYKNTEKQIEEYEKADKQKARNKGYVVCTAIFWFVGLMVGLVLVYEHDMIWWTMLITIYLVGAIPDSFFIKDQSPAKALSAVSFGEVIGRYLSSLIFYVPRFVWCIRDDRIIW